jgi:hypothetical protein
MIQIKNATQVGLCEVTVSLEYHEVAGYKITIPDDWFCQIVGVASNNLYCRSLNNQEVFLQSLITELPIAQADEAVSVFQEGEGNWSDPIVGTNEKRISRELLTIGDKQVLKLLTQDKDSFLLRYFIENQNSLYVLMSEMKDLDDQESKRIVIILEEAAQSMQFLR